MKFLEKGSVVVLVRVILGVMLLYACFDKIADPAKFARSVANYQMIPFEFSNIVAIVLPWIELYVGVCLIVGIFLDGASLLTMGMMVFFIIALSQATLRGLDIECGCFKGPSKVGVRRIVEDVLWFAMAYVVWRRKERVLEIFPKSV